MSLGVLCSAVSYPSSKIEHMFDKLAGVGEAELLAAMSDAQRGERRAIARRLIAAGRLCQRRIADSGEDEQQWCIDNWEQLPLPMSSPRLPAKRASRQCRRPVTCVPNRNTAPRLR